MIIIRKRKGKVKIFTWENFYQSTVADWKQCEIPERQPDYISFSGSVYWNYGNKVRRLSDHWGKNIASCCWYLDYRDIKLKYCLCGECYFYDFRSISTIW